MALSITVLKLMSGFKLVHFLGAISEGVCKFHYLTRCSVGVLIIRISYDHRLVYAVTNLPWSPFIVATPPTDRYHATKRVPQSFITILFLKHGLLNYAYVF